jgi:cleavage and polyadenylation specificity factor subunit 1
MKRFYHVCVPFRFQFTIILKCVQYQLQINLDLISHHYIPGRWHKYLQEVKPTYWILLTRDNGNLEIYTLPDFRLSYLVRNFGQGLRVLVDSLGAIPTSVGISENTPPIAYDSQVREILMVALGHHGSRPLLVVRLDDELLLYQAYRYPRGYLKLRFRRLAHSIHIRERRYR